MCVCHCMHLCAYVCVQASIYVYACMIVSVYVFEYICVCPRYVLICVGVFVFM